MKPILEVKNVWKSYKIGARQERYLSLRDSMVGFLKNGWQKKETFWALKDVSFDVYPGEPLGIIGRNGAGKTTLLKILSRITPPTKGSIKVRGRLASLLEVGTGFHPELTGRENIYLNGSILGLKRREINRQFDAIVDFSGVEDFLDTPLKHYSSGMQLRLAFAVAAHLEPEILLIDEVLAVGDEAFQKKCIGKMNEVTKSGRTLIFVSHNLSVIKALCPSTVLLNEGKLIEVGDSNKVIDKYLNQQNCQELQFKRKLKNKPHFISIRMAKESIIYNEPLILEIEIYSPWDTEIGIELEIRDSFDTPLSYSSTAPMQGQLVQVFKDTLNSFQLEINDVRMAAGRYSLYLWLIRPWEETFDNTRSNPISFSIIHADPFGSNFDFKQSYNRGNFHHHISISRK